MSGEHESLLEAILDYVPNTALALSAGAIFSAMSLALAVRLAWRKDFWGLCLPIGTLAYSTGFKLRPRFGANPDSLPDFLSMQLLLVCSPGAFLAFNYIVYGRFIRHRIGDRFSAIKPRLVARLFILSDILCFLVQGAGGGMQSSAATAGKGRLILLAGLIAQTISYIVFVTLAVHSHRRIAKEPEVLRGDSLRVIWLLYWSSLFILIRCVYRVVEEGQGRHGFLLTHEVFFYALDTLPLFLAIAVYIPFWPGKHVQPRVETTLIEQK